MNRKFTNISKLIKTARVDVGLSQAELARRIGCHGQFISNIERGKCSVPVKDLNTISVALMVSREKIRRAMINDYEAYLNEL